MDQPVPSSPAWKKPSDVMKVRLKGKKRRSVSASHHQANAKATLPGSQGPDASTGEVRTGKRRNPFGHSSSARERKRAHSEILPGETEGGSHQNKLFDALDTEAGEVFQESSTSSPAILNRIKSESDTNLTRLAQSEEPKATADTGQSKSLTWKDSYPVDWCLKTRVRFLSDSPFTWCGTLKTNEEAAGLSWFTRGTHHDETIPADEKDAQSRSRLHQCGMVWMHPSLPWVKLYPRIHNEGKQTRPSFVANDKDLQDSLLTSWCESFRSLFHQLRAGHCPYFYLCGYQSTVLFRAAGVGGFKHVHAFLTPTTKGLRELFKAEGIEVSMPLVPSQGDNNENGIDQEHSNSHQPVKTEEDEDDDEEEFNQEGDDAASSWLQSMGLDQQSFPTLDPRRVKFQRDESIKLDNRPQSLVLISGSSTQALYNFLLNSDIMIAPTGTQAGIPPTLLSPAPFEGGTLTASKVKSGKLQIAVGTSMQGCFHLEVTGPILPSNVHALTQLVSSSQERFSVNLSNHSPTIMFSAVPPNNAISLRDRKSKLVNCNLSPELMDYFTKGEDTDDHATIQELVFKEEKYSWTSLT
ncbi:protein downstream neighbor of son homolog [Amphiura filiformis]|uniref:protein downstream neighbor of son homolog n=1 Tax=Amphiura filiformis TaxID=82378 RepID=UPI003B20DF1B